MSGSDRNPFVDLVNGTVPPGWTRRVVSYEPLHVEASHPSGGFMCYCAAKEESIEDQLRALPDYVGDNRHREIGKITNIKVVLDE